MDEEAAAQAHPQSVEPGHLGVLALCRLEEHNCCLMRGTLQTLGPRRAGRAGLHTPALNARLGDAGKAADLENFEATVDVGRVHGLRFSGARLRGFVLRQVPSNACSAVASVHNTRVLTLRELLLRARFWLHIKGVVSGPCCSNFDKRQQQRFSFLPIEAWLSMGREEALQLRARLSNDRATVCSARARRVQQYSHTARLTRSM